LFHLLEEESRNYSLFTLSQTFLPFEEEVLESKVASLSESEPLLLRQFIELGLEVVKKLPGFLGLMEFRFHCLVVLELGWGLAKVLSVDVKLLDFPF
jgi:hypothetical protein